MRALEDENHIVRIYSPVSVPEPSNSFVQIVDGAQHDLGTQVVGELGNKRGLDGQLLVYMMRRSRRGPRIH
jgi:hypothetical protein